MRMSLGEKTSRVVRFLLGVRAPRVALALSEFGFKQADMQEGWALIHALGKGRLLVARPAPLGGAETLRALDAWENRWFPIAHAALERRFPAAREALARSAGHVREAALLLEELARSDASAVGAASRLNAERLAALGPSRAANVLRRFLAQHGERAPGLARTREMLRQLTDAGAHASPAIDLERHSVRRYRGWIELAPKTARAEANVLLPWHGERTLALADGGELIAAEGVGNGVSAVRLRMAPVTVRRRHGGERLRTAHARHSRTLKNLLQEAGVPPWLRGRMPLVYCGDALVWAPFVGVAAEFRAHATEASWRFRWRPAQSREVFG